MSTVSIAGIEQWNQKFCDFLDQLEVGLPDEYTPRIQEMRGSLDMIRTIDPNSVFNMFMSTIGPHAELVHNRNPQLAECIGQRPLFRGIDLKQAMDDLGEHNLDVFWFYLNMLLKSAHTIKTGEADTVMQSVLATLQNQHIPADISPDAMANMVFGLLQNAQGQQPSPKTKTSLPPPSKDQPHVD